jgi:type IV pilus assembly protein PilB
VYEIMTVSPGIRRVVSAGGGAEEIQDVALKEGMTTLRNGAAKLALQGITSVAEVERIATE